MLTMKIYYDNNLRVGPFTCRESLTFYLRNVKTNYPETEVSVEIADFNRNWAESVLKFFGYNYELTPYILKINLGKAGNIKPFDVSMLVKVIRNDLYLDVTKPFEETLDERIRSYKVKINRTYGDIDDMLSDSRSVSYFLNISGFLIYFVYLTNRQEFLEIEHKFSNRSYNGIFTYLSNLYTNCPPSRLKYNILAFRYMQDFIRKYNFSILTNLITIESNNLIALLEERINFLNEYIEKYNKRYQKPKTSETKEIG